MNTIVPIAISQLSHGEMHRTVSTLPSILDALSDEHIQRQLLPIGQASSILLDIMQAPKGSDVTDDIHATNDELDGLIPVIISALENAVDQKAFFVEKGEAAQQVLDRIELCDRRKLQHGGYGDQLAQLETLLEDLLAESFAATLATADITPLVQHLNGLRTKLQTLLTARLQEGKATTTQTEQRKIINYRLDKLIAYLDTNIADDVDGFAAVKEPVNELFTEVMGSYRARVARKKAE